jgi:uncharacterized membrane protein YedE/YeeE
MTPEFLLQFKDWISQPWPWWVAGPMIALVMFVLLFFGKEFGISANLRVMCAADGAEDMTDFFKFDWKSQGWNLMVALGALFGGYIAAHYFSGEQSYAHISENTYKTLQALPYFAERLPSQAEVPLVPDFYSWEALFTWRGLLIICGGGFLVGFGARYAGGCTSGHAISGLSALQLGSLIAVIGFFLGGLAVTYLVVPLIF